MAWVTRPCSALSRQEGPRHGRHRVPRQRSHRHQQRVVEAAARNAVATAAKSVRDIRIAELLRSDLVIENGAVTGFRVRLAISFKFESGD